MVLAAILALGVVFGAGWAAGTGLKIGAYDPFSLSVLATGWGAMLLAAFGGPVALIAAAVLSLPPDLPGDRAGIARDRLFFLFALLFPLGVALLRLGNSGNPRYLLLSGVGALMLVAIHTGPRLAPGRWDPLADDSGADGRHPRRARHRLADRGSTAAPIRGSRSMRSRRARRPAPRPRSSASVPAQCCAPPPPRAIMRSRW